MEKKLKIAMIGHKIVPSREGGVEIAVEEISTRLVQKGNKVDVYNRKRKGRKLKNYKGINIITIPTINKKGLDALIYSILATLVALFRHYDIIHYHAEGSCAMIWLPHLFKIKTVATIHGLDWQRKKWGGIASNYIKFGEKMAAKYADEIIVLSKDIEKYFKDKYNRNTYYIPNGVNKPLKRPPNIIKKYGLEKDNYILFLARIVPEKGLHYLIEAYNQLNTNKKLVIAGASSHTEEYYNEIKKMIKGNENIIMTGFVEGEELDELYSNCFLYCLPSDVEGMALSLLEAMSYGARCLVSDIQENLQIIGSYAYTFKKGDVKDLKEKLNYILNCYKDINANEISNYVLNKFSWDDITDETKKIYLKEVNI